MSHRTAFPFGFLSSLLVASAPLAPLGYAADWPNWRGPTHNNTSVETTLPADWSPRGGAGSNLIWKSEELAGRSTPIVMAGRLYTLVRDQPGTELEGEKLVCADAATGKVVWQHRFNVYLSDVPDTRVGWSSVVGDPDTGRVYAQGVCGYFCCLDGASGEVVWQRSLHEELGLLSTYGGRTNFPLVYRDTVITSAVVIGWGDTPRWGLLAKPAHRFLAFDKATGELRWLSGTRLIPYDTTYSTPVLTTIGAQDLLVFGSGDGAVWGMQAATGKTVWHAQLSRRGINTSPVVSPDGKVFIGHSEENLIGSSLGAFVAVDGASSGRIAEDEVVWKKYDTTVGKSSPLFIDGKVYATTDSAKMLVFDAATGEQLSRKPLGRVSRSTPLYADGKIYYGSRGGRFYTLEPQADGSLKTVSKVSLRGEQIDASPIVSGGRLYVTTSEALYCIGNDASIAANPADADSTDLPVFSSDLDIPFRGGSFGPAVPAFGPPQPAQLQLSPYDALLAPGETLQLTARLFGENGRPAEKAAVDSVVYEVTGPGEVSPTGLYTAPAGASHECVLIAAKAGGLSATARIRIVPPLPWDFDFEDGAGEVPLTWVGGRVRYNLREDAAGNHYLAKPTELPTRPGRPTTKLGTRSRMWMGPSDLADYTIEADVQMQVGSGGEAGYAGGGSDELLPEFPAATTDASVKLPSLGLINSGYTFTLFGPSNEARLYSWCTHDKRTQAAVPMAFEAGKWYTVKLRVAPDEAAEVAKVSAKVWPRGDAEPEAWTLEFEDRAPNYRGSPGLFGDAKEAEFYVDNLSVDAN
ncbi:MAG: PQQ-binding-like beta-propeller repeat protein [Planctomycetota bacterium]